MSTSHRLSLAFVAIACLAVLAVGGKPAIDTTAQGAEHAVKASFEPSPSSTTARSQAPSAPLHEGIDDPTGIATQHAFEIAEGERMARDRELYRELKNKIDRTSLESQMLHNLEETSRYPTSNQRFASRTHDPVARRNGPELRSKKSADGHSMLWVSTNATQIDVGASLEVSAELRELGATGPVARTEPGLLSLTLVGEDLSKVAELPLVGNASGQYVATLDSKNIAGRPLHGGFYKLIVEGPEQLRAISAFEVRPAYAKLTGQYRDRQQGGALHIEAEVDAFAQGRYVATATLYTDDDIPIGTAQAAQQLDAGTHWVTLTFSGLLVRDGGRNGPYRLGHIAIDKQSTPVSVGVSAAPNYQTAAYALGDFSAEPYHRLDAPADDTE